MGQLINILKESTFTVKVFSCEFSVNSSIFDDNITLIGVKVEPIWIEVIPEKIRANIICKKESGQTNEQIYSELLSGNYFLNIKDYSDYEISIACNQIVSQLIADIWESLLSDKNGLNISLNEEIAQKIVLDQNKELFENEDDFKNFCTIRNLSVTDFIIPASISGLSIKLKEISVRLETEQFFARRFLFTDMLILKLEERISQTATLNLIKNGKIDEIRVWMNNMKESNMILQKYKNYQILYDMPKQEIRVENNENVTFINGNVEDSNINISNSKESTKKGSKFDKKIKIAGILVSILTFIISLIVNWDKVNIFFHSL